MLTSTHDVRKIARSYCKVRKRVLKQFAKEHQEASDSVNQEWRDAIGAGIALSATSLLSLVGGVFSKDDMSNFLYMTVFATLVIVGVLLIAYANCITRKPHDERIAQKRASRIGELAALSVFEATPSLDQLPAFIEVLHHECDRQNAWKRDFLNYLTSLLVGIGLANFISYVSEQANCALGSTSNATWFTPNLIIAAVVFALGLYIGVRPLIDKIPATQVLLEDILIAKTNGLLESMLSQDGDNATITSSNE